MIREGTSLEKIALYLLIICIPERCVQTDMNINLHKKNSTTVSFWFQNQLTTHRLGDNAAIAFLPFKSSDANK